MNDHNLKLDFVEQQVKDVFQKNSHYTQTGIVDELMTTIHPSSLAYANTKQLMEQLLTTYQLNVESKKYEYIGKDKSYAYARVQQQISKISGPEYKNSITDQLMVFKQDGNEWKIWTTAILNIKYLD